MLLKKLTVAQLLTKFHTFYKIIKGIAVVVLIFPPSVPDSIVTKLKYYYLLRCDAA
jgi:hypothetical protein